MYILSDILGWIPPAPASESNISILSITPADCTAFKVRPDYEIKRNDWPYGTTRDICHVVVWSKAPLAIDNEGDPTMESQQLINDFVQRVFKDRIEADDVDDRVLWFRNRTQWQSVRSLEHIHVLLRGVDEALIEEWTGQRESDIQARKWSGGRKIIET
jgi:hypothetical protein